MKSKYLLPFLTLLFIASCKQTEKDNQIIRQDNNNGELKREIDSLKRVNDSLSKIIPEDQPGLSTWYDAEFDSRYLLSSGISDPENFIINSLRDKPELIPGEAVLGGTMRFIDIQPLGPKWVIAYFEDGHVGGRALFKYKLNDQGELEFKLLDFHEI